jgi:SAM-dependent methyltransferase
MYAQYDKLVVRRDPPPFQINKRQDSYVRKRKVFLQDLPRYHRDMEMLCRLLDVREGMRILEIGGDVGFASLELANLGARCIGVDICPGSPEFVTKLAQFYNLDVTSMWGDTCCLPFVDETFDAVFSKDTFEHIWDTDAALREQTRVLRRNGRLVILVGNLANPKTFIDQFFRKFFASRGREGGLKWFLTKQQALEDFGMGWHGKNEDIKTSRWWKKTMSSAAGLELVEMTTSRAYNNPGNRLYRAFKPFVGGHVILAVKR